MSLPPCLLFLPLQVIPDWTPCVIEQVPASYVLSIRVYVCQLWFPLSGFLLAGFPEGALPLAFLLL